MFLKIFFIASLISIAFSVDCPTNGKWTDVPGIGCFHFATEANLYSWFEAEQYCRDFEEGAWLLEIPNDYTQALINGLMAEIDHHQDWWIGATDVFAVT